MPKSKAHSHSGSPPAHHHVAHHNNNIDMDGVKIKRVKRNKKEITTKEKIVAGIGVGSSLMGGAGAVAPVAQTTQFVRTTPSKGSSATSKIKAALGNIFGIKSAKADTLSDAVAAAQSQLDNANTALSNYQSWYQSALDDVNSPTVTATGQPNPDYDYYQQNPDIAAQRIQDIQNDYNQNYPTYSQAVTDAQNGLNAANAALAAASQVVTPPPVVTGTGGGSDPGTSGGGAGGAPVVTPVGPQEGDTQTVNGLTQTYYLGNWVWNNGQTADGSNPSINGVSGVSYGSQGNQWIILDGQTVDGSKIGQTAGTTYLSSGGQWVAQTSAVQGPKIGDTQNQGGLNYIFSNAIYSSGAWTLVDGQTDPVNFPGQITQGGAWVTNSNNANPAPSNGLSYVPDGRGGWNLVVGQTASGTTLNSAFGTTQYIAGDSYTYDGNSWNDTSPVLTPTKNPGDNGGLSSGSAAAGGSGSSTRTKGSGLAGSSVDGTSVVTSAPATVTSISLANGNSATIKQGGSFANPAAVVTYSDGTTDTRYTVFGAVNVNIPGTYALTYLAGGVSQTFTVTVTAASSGSQGTASVGGVTMNVGDTFTSTGSGISYTVIGTDGKVQNVSTGETGYLDASGYLSQAKPTGTQTFNNIFDSSTLGTGTNGQSVVTASGQILVWHNGAWGSPQSGDKFTDAAGVNYTFKSGQWTADAASTYTYPTNPKDGQSFVVGPGQIQVYHNGAWGAPKTGDSWTDGNGVVYNFAAGTQNSVTGSNWVSTPDGAWVPKTTTAGQTLTNVSVNLLGQNVNWGTKDQDVLTYLQNNPSIAAGNVQVAKDSNGNITSYTITTKDSTITYSPQQLANAIVGIGQQLYGNNNFGALTPDQQYLYFMGTAALAIPGSPVVSYPFVSGGPGSTGTARLFTPSASIIETDTNTAGAPGVATIIGGENPANNTTLTQAQQALKLLQAQYPGYTLQLVGVDANGNIDPNAYNVSGNGSTFNLVYPNTNRPYVINITDSKGNVSSVYVTQVMSALNSSGTGLNTTAIQSVVAATNIAPGDVYLNSNGPGSKTQEGVVLGPGGSSVVTPMPAGVSATANTGTAVAVSVPTDFGSIPPGGWPAGSTVQHYTVEPNGNIVDNNTGKVVGNQGDTPGSTTGTSSGSGTTAGAVGTLTLSQTSVSLTAGSFKNVTFAFTDTGATAKGITATSSNASVATVFVDANGGTIRITGLSAGTAVITVHPTAMGSNTSKDKIITVSVGTAGSSTVTASTTFNFSSTAPGWNASNSTLSLNVGDAQQVNVTSTKNGVVSHSISATTTATNILISVTDGRITIVGAAASAIPASIVLEAADGTTSTISVIVVAAGASPASQVNNGSLLNVSQIPGGSGGSGLLTVDQINTNTSPAGTGNLLNVNQLGTNTGSGAGTGTSTGNGTGTGSGTGTVTTGILSLSSSSINMTTFRQDSSVRATVTGATDHTVTLSVGNSSIVASAVVDPNTGIITITAGSFAGSTTVTVHPNALGSDTSKDLTINVNVAAVGFASGNAGGIISTGNNSGSGSSGISVLGGVTSQPFSGLQMPSGSSGSFQGLQMQATNDLSSRYANVSGTIYDKTTGHGFATPAEFFAAAGVSSFNGLVFDTNWKPAQVQGASTTGSTTYTVKKGDTLWNIAKKYYGDGKQWRTIMSANTDKVKNPKSLKVGTVLVIPGANN